MEHDKGSVVGWLIVGLLVGLAVLRGSGWDEWAPAVAVLAVSPWLWFAAWPVAAVAGLRRRWRLTGAAGVLVAAQVWWVGPQWIPLSSVVATHPGEIVLRILDANVTWTNPDMTGIAGQISRGHPDIVTLEEVTGDDVAALTATHVLDRFPFQLVAASEGSEGMAVWSRVPLTAAAQWDDAGHPALRAVVRAPGAVPATLLVVHPYIPFGLPVQQWHDELRAVAADARRAPRPLVVVGDFNATWDMPEFQHILKLGLRDAAVVAGRGWAMTWAPQSGLPAVARLDHLLLSAPLQVSRYRQAPVAGAQHHSLTVDLVLPGARSGTVG